MDIVNINKLKIGFTVVSFDETNMPDFMRTTFFHMSTPYHHGRARQTKTLNKEGFLAHPVLRLSGDPVTIKNVIRYAANVAGGVHFDPNPREEYFPFSKINCFFVSDMPAAIYLLRDIGRVFMEGTEQLQQEVIARQSL